MKWNIVMYEDGTATIIPTDRYVPRMSDLTVAVRTFAGEKVAIITTDGAEHTLDTFEAVLLIANPIDKLVRDHEREISTFSVADLIEKSCDDYRTLLEGMRPEELEQHIMTLQED